MALTLERTKEYLRVDSDDDDALVTSLMVASASYMAAAVDGYSEKCKSDSQFSALGDAVELALIAEMYENRNVSGQEAKDYSYTVRSIITQLQNWSDST